MKKSLPTMRPEQEGLGRSTIMDPGLAARHGIPYVHLAAFAIDVDRIREAVDEDEQAESLWPFGFEVFLTEMYLASTIDAADEAQLEFLDDVVEQLLGMPKDAEDPPLGAQLVFAIHDAVQRGLLPASLGEAFARWKKRPAELVRSLDELFERAPVEASDLAEACLEIALGPPIAPPTRDALEALVATYDHDGETTLDDPE